MEYLPGLELARIRRLSRHAEPHLSAYVIIRQHTSAYVSIIEVIALPVLELARIRRQRVRERENG
jgi:hypothetical protein